MWRRPKEWLSIAVVSTETTQAGLLVVADGWRHVGEPGGRRHISHLGVTVIPLQLCNDAKSLGQSFFLFVEVVPDSLHLRLLGDQLIEEIVITCWNALVEAAKRT